MIKLNGWILMGINFYILLLIVSDIDSLVNMLLLYDDNLWYIQLGML